MDFVASFDTSSAVSSTRAWREETAKLRTELEAVGALAAAGVQMPAASAAFATGGAAAPGGWAPASAAPFSTATDFDFKRSKWEDPPKQRKPRAKPGEKSGAAKKKGASKGAQMWDTARTSSAAATASIWKHVGALGALGAAYAGLQGTSSLTRMAIGWRGLAALQMVSWKAQMDLRRAVMGTDAQPLVRAAKAFEQNLSKSTVTGNALSGLLTRGFNSFFRLIEAAEPLATGLFQRLVLNSLRLENAWLRLRIAALPITSALGELIDVEDALDTAAIAGGVALAGMAAYAAALAAPYLAAAAAVGVLTKQILDLKAAWDSASPLKVIEAISKIGGAGAVSSLGQSAGQSIVRRFGLDEAAKAAAGRLGIGAGAGTTRPAGVATGQVMADGLVEGMANGGDRVEAAGAALGKRAEKGVRKATETHSPSQAFRRVGRDLGAGEELGLKDKASDIQRAADSALVPQGPAGGGAVNGGGGPIHLEVHNHFPEFKGGNRGELEAALEAAHARFARNLALQMGRPVVLR